MASPRQYGREWDQKRLITRALPCTNVKSGTIRHRFKRNEVLRADQRGASDPTRREHPGRWRRTASGGTHWPAATPARGCWGGGGGRPPPPGGRRSWGCCAGKPAATAKTWPTIHSWRINSSYFRFENVRKNKYYVYFYVLHNEKLNEKLFFIVDKKKSCGRLLPNGIIYKINFKIEEQTLSRRS